MSSKIHRFLTKLGDLIILFCLRIDFETTKSYQGTQKFKVNYELRMKFTLQPRTDGGLKGKKKNLV